VTSPAATSRERRARRIVHALFFASGVSGLIYQVAWVRAFGLVFGNTMHSASLVTSIFMGGLGLGSYLAGRAIDRRVAQTGDRQGWGALVAYGRVELAIAAAGLALALVLPRMGGLIAAASSYQVDAGGWHVLSTGSWLVRVGLAVVLLAAPCLLMGATLTLLVRFVVGEQTKLAGWRIGALYGINTGGAALGALLTDFFLIPAAGVLTAQGLAVALNVVAGIGALALARGVELKPAAPAAADEPDDAASDDDDGVTPAAIALGLSGFAAMGFEIVWFRYISQLLGGLRATFSLLIAVMLVALWAGATVSGALSRRTPRPAAYFVASQGVLVVLLLALLALPNHEAAYAAHLVAIKPEVLAASGPARSLLVLWTSLWRIVVIVAAPAFLMGFAFPLANAQVQRQSRHVGRRLGLLYFANTLGNVGGAALAGFVLLPMLGIDAAVLILALVALLSIAPWLVTALTQRDKYGALVSGLAALAGMSAIVALTTVPRDRLLLPALPSDLGGAQRTLAVSEGPYETIVVTEIPGVERRLNTNGHSMSGTGHDSQRYMRLFSHLPLLNMEAPKRVLVISFGVGNTAHAATLHPSLETLAVADLSRNVLSHAEYFAGSNGHVLRDPRTKVHVDDGRNHLRMVPPGTYDLVTLEPPPIFFAGVSSLYSRQMYALANERLADGGYVTQWLPAYQVEEHTVLELVRAFVEVFPQSIMLVGDARELILMGRRGGPISLDPALLAARLRARPAVARDLADIEIPDVRALLEIFAATPERLAEATAGVPPVTDDWPSPEHSQRSGVRATRMPAALFGPSEIGAVCPSCAEVAGLPELLAFRERYYRSDAYLAAGAFQAEAQHFVADDDAARQAVALSSNLQRVFGDRGHLARDAALRHRAASRHALAVQANQYALRLSAEHPASLSLAGLLQLDEGRHAEAEASMRRALDLAPNSATIHFDLAILFMETRRERLADEALARVLTLEPRHAPALAARCFRAVERDEPDASRACTEAEGAGVALPETLKARLRDR
jgi:spermidine synthase